MPIEIKELHIKVQAEESAQKNSDVPAANDEARVNAIVAECVEQVLTILKEKQER